MKTIINIDIPDELRKRIESKSWLNKLNIPTAAELYQAWVDGTITLSLRAPEPPPSTLSHEEQVRQGNEWLENWKKLLDNLDRTPVADSKSGIEILMEDRNRLERPYSVPVGTVAKSTQKEAT